MRKEEETQRGAVRETAGSTESGGRNRGKRNTILQEKNLLKPKYNEKIKTMRAFRGGERGIEVNIKTKTEACGRDSHGRVRGAPSSPLRAGSLSS